MADPIPHASPPRAASRARPSRWPAALALLAAALLLVGESLLPGRLFVPLHPGDFADLAAGADARALPGHPHPDWCMSDVLHLLVPGLAVNQRAAAAGRLPLWDDGQALGVPHLHQVHYAVLYPPAWLPLALGWDGLAWMALLHLLVAGGGTCLYLEALGRSRTAALLGALAFLASAWFTARLHNFSVAGAAAWLPWVLWGLERAVQAGCAAGLPPGAPPPRAPARRYLGAAAAALALSFLAGFPQVALWVGAAAALLELLRAAVALRQRRPWAAPLARAAGALALGTALAAPQLLPTLDWLRHDGLRGAQSPEVVAADALDPALLWHLIVPERYATGALAGAHPLALRDVPAARNPAAVNRAEVSLGIGVLGLLLAVLAAAFGRGWRTRAWAAAAAGILLLLCWPAALRAGAEVLPLLRFGNPRRLLLLSSFALCVLAAGGLDLVRGKRLAVTVVAWLLAVLLLGAALLARLTVPSAGLDADVERWAGRLAQQLDQPGLDGAGLLQLVPASSFRVAAGRAAASALVAVAVAAACVLLFRPRRRPTRRGWSTFVRREPALLAWLLAAELLLAAFPLLRAGHASALAADPAALARLDGLDAPPLVQAVRAAAPAGPAPTRLARLGDEPPWLRPNFAGLFGLSDLSAYAPMVPRRASDLLEAIEPGLTLSGSALGGLRRPEVLAAPLLDLLGVQVLLTSREDTGPLPAGWREAARVGPVRVLANDDALPAAFVAHAADVLPDPAQRLQRLGAADFDPRRVLLEQPPPVALPAAPPREPRAVAVSAWSPGAIELRVAAGEPGLLVLPLGWHAGWRARAGGQELPVLRADHALLAVPLAARQDVVVTLDFDPPWLPAGFAIGGLALAGLLALCAWPSRRSAAPAGSVAP